MIYDYEYFKKEIYSLTTIDLNAYKEKQMKRRIDTLIAKHKIVGYDKYVQALKTDRELFEEFVGYITINVSEFYRNPEQWKYPLQQIHIYATDLDKQVIAKAKTGLYNEKSIEGVPEDLKKKYFTKIGPSYKIADEIKARVDFHQHNLLKDAYPTEYHLIVCRNVLIYFTEEAKDEVFRKYYHSLAKGGMLFIGSTEQIMNYREIGFERKSSFYYVKPL